MRVLYLYGSLSAREMKSQKFDARTNGCLQELSFIIDLSRPDGYYSGDLKPHIMPCLSVWALFVGSDQELEKSLCLSLSSLSAVS